MSRIKTKEEIVSLRKGGKILAKILKELALYAKPGVSTGEINDYALKLVEDFGAEPVLLGYHPEFASIPYHAALCTSVNDTVQHGIPHPKEILEEGDIINLDMSIGYEGMIVDSGITFGLGTITQREEELLKVTREALK